jgi:hypothetical protein
MRIDFQYDRDEARIFEQEFLKKNPLHEVEVFLKRLFSCRFFRSLRTERFRFADFCFRDFCKFHNSSFRSKRPETPPSPGVADRAHRFAVSQGRGQLFR